MFIPLHKPALYVKNKPPEFSLCPVFLLRISDGFPAFNQKARNTTSFTRPRNDSVPICVHAHVAIAEGDGRIAFPRAAYQTLRQQAGNGFGPTNPPVGQNAFWSSDCFAVGSDGHHDIHASHLAHDTSCTPNLALHLYDPRKKRQKRLRVH